MYQTSLDVVPVVVCVLDEDASTLETTTNVLSSAGYQVRPFADPDTFIENVRIHRPQVAIVDFGGPRGSGLALSDRLRKLSPMTSVLVSLKIHRSKAQGVLFGSELVNLIKSMRPSLEPSSLSGEREAELGYGG